MPNENATAPLPVVVFADFICPYSYIALDQMDDLLRDYNIELLWRPHWLHPEVPPAGAPIPAEAATVGRRAQTLAWLKEMAPERSAHMRFPDRIQFSLFAFEALEFAQDHGLALPFKTAVFESLWADGRDIAQFSTLQAAAAKVGLDSEELGRALSAQRYRKRVHDALQLARDAGVTKTPTFVLGRYRIAGWHYYEVFQTVMEKQNVLLRSALDNSSPPAER
ncbi:MAG TPA: DsbA family protein [Candidatus Binataceae bacterium]|nr:DsbA family protein [Candidatus Binataceae bacterium]